jgi:hypothetical protein
MHHWVLYLSRIKMCLKSFHILDFDKSIEEFKLPVVDSFLYRNTDGLMDRIANITQDTNE